jgi:hypothetical protein
MNTTRWENKISHNRTDILETGVLERTGLTTDLTAMEYEDVDWVHLFQDRTQRETLVSMKMKLRRFGLRGGNLQQISFWHGSEPTDIHHCFPEMKHTYCTYVTSLSSGDTHTH